MANTFLCAQTTISAAVALWHDRLSALLQRRKKSAAPHAGAVPFRKRLPAPLRRSAQVWRDRTNQGCQRVFEKAGARLRRARCRSSGIQEGVRVVSEKVLLTGRPGCGKMTLIKRVVNNLPRRAGGFHTEEIRDGVTRAGFKIVTLDVDDGVSAH